MLELRDVSLFIDNGSDVHPLLADISAQLPKGHFAAIIGPSGCGKSSLLKTIAGIAHGDEEGDIFWEKHNLNERDFAPSEIGYVPQFSIAHEELTVLESVDTALRLRVAGLSTDDRELQIERILTEVGLHEFSNRRVSVLSGGQKRRLSLAMEVVSKPAIMLCDEVTSGLDPQSEDEIVHLLRDLSRHDDRLILSVTHSLQHLHLYDSVIVLYQGVLAYHGPADYLAHYFRVDDANALYSQLDNRKADDWKKSWKKYHDHFQAEILDADSARKNEPPASDEKFTEKSSSPSLTDDTSKAGKKDIPQSATLALPEDFSTDTKKEKSDKKKQALEAEFTAIDEDPPSTNVPGIFSQFAILLARRLKIFFRNSPQLWLQLGLIFGFPVLVAIFAWNGLPNVKSLGMSLDQDIMQQLVEAKQFVVDATKTGSLVSGIVMFQVILLTLMGANNAGREIAGERLIFEKEKLSGVSPISYVTSKVVFILILVTLQSVWMGVFVDFICDFPAPLGQQLVFLWLVNAAMSMTCLALSAWLGSAEQASLASIYLVGFQLPLSGAVLALPALVSTLTKPFIAAYWSWSGVLQTLKADESGSRYYDIVQMVSQTSLSPALVCLWVLGVHVLIGILFAWQGCLRPRMS
ncbi:MAG: ATP-binding cassette domain-containing protein [Chthoniobacterales bacterium]